MIQFDDCAYFSDGLVNQPPTRRVFFWCRNPGEVKFPKLLEVGCSGRQFFGPPKKTRPPGLGAENFDTKKRRISGIQYTYIFLVPPPPPKPTFGHFLTVFTVFCNLFGTLNFEANFEGGCIHLFIFLYVCVPVVCVCVCVSDLMCSDKVLRRY